MAERVTAESQKPQKHGLLKAGCAVLLLFLLLVGSLIYMLLAATAKKNKTIDGCSFNAAIATAAVGSIQWRVPLGQTYVVATSSTPTSLDLAATDPQGNSSAGPVLTAQAGTVRVTTATSVTVDHGEEVSLTYANLAKVSASKGTKMGVGQIIGQVAAGRVLTITATREGSPIDPKAYLTSQGVKLDGTKPPAPISQDAQKVTGSAGTGFNLPAPSDPRQDSLHNKPLAPPANVLALYQAAAKQYGLPWTLLAGIGMEETAHGANKGTSSAGAQGLMQFMPATFASYGVDGDGDGRKDINNDADSAFAAANYLVASGATKGPEGVKKALYAYNHADWYVNDVLYYASAYGGGNVTATAANTPECLNGGDGDSTSPGAMGPVSPGQIGTNIQAMNSAYQRWVGGSLIDPGRWYSRECVSWTGFFVRTQYPEKYGNFSNHFRGAAFGNAQTWAGAARQAGIPIDSTPAVGSIGVRTSGRWGHVASVIGVNPDGTFTIAEYNHVQRHQFSVRTNVRVGNGSDDFLYFIHFER